jgi:hypothetical protein
MKKTLLLIIAALFAQLPIEASSMEKGSFFGGTGTSAQAPLPSVRVVQYNQWNNLLPYAACTLLGTAAGMSYRYYKKYDAKHTKHTADLDAANKTLKPKVEKLDEYNKVATALEEMDQVVQFVKSSPSQTESRAQRVWQLHSVLDCSDRSRINADIIKMNSAARAKQILPFSEATDSLKATIKLMQDVNTRRITEVTGEMEQPNKDKKAAEDKIAAITRKKTIVQWTGIGCGVAAAGISLAKIYSWFYKK